MGTRKSRYNPNKYKVGKEFYPNLIAIAAAYGITYNTLSKYLKANPTLSLDEVVILAYRKSEITIDNVKHKNMAAVSVHYNIATKIIYNRMRAGWSLVDAVKTPVKHIQRRDSSNECLLFGTQYLSLAVACETLKIQRPVHLPEINMTDVIKLRIQLRTLLEYSDDAVLPNALPYAYIRGIGTFKTGESLLQHIDPKYVNHFAVDRHRSYREFILGTVGQENIPDLFLVKNFMRNMLQQLREGVSFDSLQLKDEEYLYVAGHIERYPEHAQMLSNYNL